MPSLAFAALGACLLAKWVSKQPLAFEYSRRNLIGSNLLLTNMASNDIIAEVNWGIVGLGDVCQKKSGPSFDKCEGSKLAAVMRRTPRLAEYWARANVPDGKCNGYDNLDEFLMHSPLDAVYISTRPGTHLEICRKVAAAGKAVYVEKPVGRCAAEAKEMAEICSRANVPLYTAYISRAYERTEAIRHLLSKEFEGKVNSISYKLVGLGGARGMDAGLPWRLDAAQSGGGLIMDVGCHVVDRIDYLFGPLLNVQGHAENKAKRQPVEDYVHFTATVGPSDWATVSCEGASVSCTWDFSGKQPREIDEFVIAGPKGSLKMAGMSPAGPIEVFDARGTLIKTVGDFTMPEHTAQALIQAVTNDLRGVVNSKTHCLSRIDNAIRTQSVLDEALSSYYGGREVGFWTRPESWPGKPKIIS